ncbi:prepilin-type N-terminal cleavage/methylation domain-containing protein [Patescibacteria group bacterium]|nr:prepilin-type N-terminal cleavage/methylation domain-containing protein [Patescibacteria group bacterium]
MNLNEQIKIQKNQQGFSLIETLIALTILILALLTMVQLFPLGLKNASYSRSETTAVFLAQAKMEEIISERYDQVLTGTFAEASLVTIDDDFARYSRQTVIYYVDEDLESSVQDIGLKRVDVTVSWPGGDSNRTVTINTLISDL